MIDWILVEEALKLHKTGSSATAGILLVSAMQATVLPAPSSPGKPVAYGKSGYSDSQDPRDDTANHHGDGAIHTIVHAFPDRKYKCVRVEAYGPQHVKGGGRHVAYVQTTPGREDIVLGTGYHGVAGEYDAKILHKPGQEVVITAKFRVPDLGPCAIFMQDSDGRIVSDEVGNLGLPGGLHFSFLVVFEAR